MMIQGNVSLANKAGEIETIDALLDNSIIKDKSLSLFQRILLTTDGTVTTLLKLYTGKTIKANKLEQQFTLSGESELSFCPLETPILRRKVLLSSETRNYVYAESNFILEYLSKSNQNKLVETDQAIGLIWKEEKFESYRQIIKYGTEPCGGLSCYFNIQPQILLLYRTYLIHHKNIVFGIITEKFPITYFKGENT